MGLIFSRTLIKWVEPPEARRRGLPAERKSLQRVLLFTLLAGGAAAAAFLAVSWELALKLLAVALSLAGLVGLIGFLSRHAPYVAEITESQVTYGFTSEPSWWKYSELSRCELSPPSARRGYGVLTLVTHKGGRVEIGMPAGISLSEVAGALESRGVAVTIKS